MKRFAPLALAVTLAATACTSQSAPTANASLAPVGSLAPSFSAAGLGGTRIAGTDFKGKVTVLNFWATWCPPCRKETPDLVRAFGKLNANDVAFLGIDTTETAPVIKSFVALKGIPYPIAIAGPETYNAFGIAYIPTTIVLDANGIVRARWTGGVTPAQLAAYVTSARAGKNAEYITPQQRRIDALVAQRRLNVVKAYVAQLNQDDATPYDFERTQREIGALEVAKARTAVDLAQGYGDLNRYADAARVLNGALTGKPHDVLLIARLANAYYRLHDYDAMAATSLTWTKLAPGDPDAWDSLGLAYQRSRRFARAAPAYRKAVDLLIETHHPARDIADESLDYASVYVALGDAPNAQKAFALAQRYADRIPPHGPGASLRTIVPQRTVEGLTAVAFARDTGTHVTLAKWNGANLPGSLGNASYRYRLVATAPAGTTVQLAVRGVQQGWIASFCQDRLCSPNHVTFTMPEDGVRSYEFQLVPPDAAAKFAPVSVGSPSSNWATTPV
jgi:cytochrome c biogenesis protein CcmG, thiol:disulfide interchange protein DsbE